MNWTDFLSSIYIINLPKRAQRRMESVKQMEQYGLPYSVWPATEMPNGADGLRATVLDIFKLALKNDFNHVLLLEDDFLIVREDINKIMPRVIDQLPKDYDMLYMGVNAFGGFPDGLLSENILRVSDGYATHAVIYSNAGMKRAVSFIESYCTLPIDVVYAKFIQPQGKCYATFPLLCSQRSGFSDIEARDVNYFNIIEKRYAEKIKVVQ